MPTQNNAISHFFVWAEPICVGEMYWNDAYSSKMRLSTISEYYFGVLPTFTLNIDQKWVKNTRF